ncbi:MAG TPA: orotate phosphoribosyltransferase, partial [Pyrinomonadaceae bacterium]|nr:orotate phosphoribosyltransferase [Pyrinomonadaceae bacterium]
RQVFVRIGEITALLLWERGAIKINLQEPFRLASGNYSPIYINCRQIISDTVFMNLFTAFAHTIFKEKRLRIDVVAGGETAGIPFAAFLAHNLTIPMVYVRKAAKEHGIRNLIEGNISEGEKVLLVDDVITDAGSKLNFIKTLREVGGVVSEVLVLFDREQSGSASLQSNEIHLHSLTNMTTVLRVLEEVNLLKGDDLYSVRGYLQNPERWHQQKNLPYKEVA